MSALGTTRYPVPEPDLGLVEVAAPRIVTPVVADPVSGFVPYPNPRYAMRGGMQPLGGGIS